MDSNQLCHSISLKPVKVGRAEGDLGPLSPKKEHRSFIINLHIGIINQSEASVCVCACRTLNPCFSLMSFLNSSFYLFLPDSSYLVHLCHSV